VSNDIRWSAPIRSTSQWARFLLGFTVLLAVLLGISEFDATGRYGLAILAIVLVAGVAVERLLYGNRLREALRLLGLGRPGSRTVLAACAVGALVQLVYPLTEQLTGQAIALRPGWPWLLIGIFAFHGVAEELVWRG
jgi:membrane protease YdiL (CAAX protease family)